ncbi:MAG: hypothetical protein HY784_01620 [Chloroflexi bacterium]|nr:hypothetical protein [Chloroflexota bacterium]
MNALPGDYRFASNSLPAVIMTHSFGTGYWEIEAQAVQLAQNCMVALAFNYFGQGWDGDHRA